MKEVLVEGKKYFVKKPTSKNINDARIFVGGIFRRMAEQDTPPITRDSLPQYLQKLGVWDDSKLELLRDLAKKINEGERQLKRGGKTKDGQKFTKDQARKLAIDMRVWRGQQLELVLQMRKYDHLTIEGITDNANFDFLVSACSFDEQSQKLFKHYDDYQSKAEEPYAQECAKALAELMYGSNAEMLEAEKNNVENKFLLDYKFARENDLRLVDNEGNLVDVEGNKVNEEGYKLDENGLPVDRNGERLNDQGDPVEEFTPFE